MKSMVESLGKPLQKAQTTASLPSRHDVCLGETSSRPAGLVTSPGYSTYPVLSSVALVPTFCAEAMLA